MDHAITVGEVLAASGGLILLILVLGAIFTVLYFIAQGFNH